MQAYERSMQHTDTHLVLRPVSDFFRYFGDPERQVAAGGNILSERVLATLKSDAIPCRRSPVI